MSSAETGRTVRSGQTVAEIGEFAMVAAITERLGTTAAVLLGPGDDAALLACPDGRAVATTDMLVEDRHFRRSWSSPYDIGRKAAARNLADVAALGGTTTALLVGLAVPGDLQVSWVLELTDGLRDEAALVDAVIIGGDLTRSELVVISVCALGDLAGGPPVTRSGAVAGDVVAVCGRLGWAEAGRAVLTRGFRSPRAVVAAHQRPEPPYDAGPEAAGLGAHALIDVSDGLIQDLGHIATASRVSIDLDGSAFEADQPVRDVGAALNRDPLTFVFTGGEDHAFAACFPDTAALPARWRVVGRVVAGEPAVTVDGEPFDAPGGWDPFR
jgi:thiamine-monophosphate kinase